MWLLQVADNNINKQHRTEQAFDRFIHKKWCMHIFHSQAMSIALQEGLLNGVKKKKRPKVKKEISNINL